MASLSGGILLLSACLYKSNYWYSYIHCLLLIAAFTRRACICWIFNINKPLNLRVHVLFTSFKILSPVVVCRPDTAPSPCLFPALWTAKLDQIKAGQNLYLNNLMRKFYFDPLNYGYDFFIKRAVRRKFLKMLEVAAHISVETYGRLLWWINIYEGNTEKCVTLCTQCIYLWLNITTNCNSFLQQIQFTIPEKTFWSELGWLLPSTLTLEQENRVSESQFC